MNSSFHSKIIDEANSDCMIIEMAAPLVEFVFQSEVGIAIDGIRDAGYKLPSKVVPLLIEPDAGIGGMGFLEIITNACTYEGLDIFKYT